MLEPHLPTGWQDISIQNLPVGTNLISFSRPRTAKGVSYDIESKENGWNFLLKDAALADGRYVLNGRPGNSASAGIRMEGTKNQVLIPAAH